MVSGFFRTQKERKRKEAKLQAQQSYNKEKSTYSLTCRLDLNEQKSTYSLTGRLKT